MSESKSFPPRRLGLNLIEASVTWEAKPTNLHRWTFSAEGDLIRGRIEIFAGEKKESWQKSRLSLVFGVFFFKKIGGGGEIFRQKILDKISRRLESWYTPFQKYGVYKTLRETNG